MYLSVNVSGRQIPDGLPPLVLHQTVTCHGFAPAALALEITEGILLNNFDNARNWLTAVRELGVRVYLDDFGTGYSSFSYLKHFPVDCIKIDRSFVRDMTKDVNDRALVEAVVAIARSLRIDVIAEGVEAADMCGCCTRWAVATPKAIISRGRCRSRPSRRSARGFPVCCGTRSPLRRRRHEPKRCRPHAKSLREYRALPAACMQPADRCGNTECRCCCGRCGVDGARIQVDRQGSRGRIHRNRGVASSMSAVAATDSSSMLCPDSRG